MPYIYVFCLGGLLGASEIIGKYSGTPIRVVLLNWATAIYCLVNSLISSFSYLLLDQLKLIEFPADAEQAEAISKILVAGLGAATVLRLGVSFQVANQTVNLSLMSIFEPILHAADSAIRQAANTKNMNDSRTIMAGISDDEAFLNLPPACFRLARLPEARQDELTREIEDLRGSAQLETVKVQDLGRILLQIVGKDVLQALVNSVKSERDNQLDKAVRTAEVDGSKVDGGAAVPKMSPG